VRFWTILACVAATGISLAAAAPSAFAAPAHQSASVLNARASTADTCANAYFTPGDWKTGPADPLPSDGIAGQELVGYQRWGRSSVGVPLTKDQFLAKYWDPQARGSQGGWIYPPADGFVIVGGRQEEYPVTLPDGDLIDRYGAASGSYLSPFGTPYADRSIPPSSLDSVDAHGASLGNCNYHEYEVLKPFAVEAGPIAPGFGQPGYGIQYLPDGHVSVQWLLDHHYLSDVVTAR